MPTLSLIVPVYGSHDLARALLAHVPSLKDAAAAAGLELVEAIFSDDGSPSTLQLPPYAGDVPVRVLRSEVNRGKGHAVRMAALEAKGDFALMSDVDESAPLTEVVRLMEGLADDVWLACGSRYVQAGQGPLALPWHRRVLSRLFNALVRLAGVAGMADTQCGFKLMRMARMRAVLSRMVVDRFAFDVELIALVRLAGGRVVEVPVEWHGGRRSSLRVMRDAPRMLLDLVRIAWRTSRISRDPEASLGRARADISGS